MSQQEMDMDEEFAGLDNAKAEGKLPKLETGKYTVQLTKTSYIPGYNGKVFVIEFKVLESTSPAVKAGESRSFTISGFDQPKRRDLALGNLKSFIAAAGRVDPNSSQKWGAIAKMLSQTNGWAGKIVDVQADVKPPKTAGFSPFINGNWTISQTPNPT